MCSASVTTSAGVSAPSVPGATRACPGGYPFGTASRNKDVLVGTSAVSITIMNNSGTSDERGSGRCGSDVVISKLCGFQNSVGSGHSLQVRGAVAQVRAVTMLAPA